MARTGALKLSKVGGEVFDAPGSQGGGRRVRFPFSSGERGRSSLGEVVTVVAFEVAA